MKREKRIKKGIESLKKQIEEHFEKLESNLSEKDEILARYHIKEIDKSLISSLESRLDLLGESNKEILEKYRKRLSKLKKKANHT